LSRPIGIAQPARENLAGILTWQIGLDIQMFRHLVIGEQRPQLRTDGSDVQLRARLRFHHRHDSLAELIVGNPEYGAVAHTGNGMQRRLDFSRIDIDAA
jgi:hypothetical protein